MTSVVRLSRPINRKGCPQRTTRIRCPECEAVQVAYVDWWLGFPWKSYVHQCKSCGYMITESEWING